MAGSERDGKTLTSGSTRSYDAVIVGGSLAGCATAMFLGRAGARVAVVEKSPDPANFKRICSHFIQASAVPARCVPDSTRGCRGGGSKRRRSGPGAGSTCGGRSWTR
jgi:glycine/D-amino acid oxidase-like deaminating enzyme